MRDFAFDTASPLVISPAAAGNLVVSAWIQMTEAFDDPAAELSLGTAASPAVLLGPAENDPATLDVYTTRIPFLVPAPTDLQLLISPAASTQGAGRVILQALLS